MSPWRSGEPGTKCSGMTPRCAPNWATPQFTVNDDTLVLAQRFRLAHVGETP